MVLVVVWPGLEIFVVKRIFAGRRTLLASGGGVSRTLPTLPGVWPPWSSLTLHPALFRECTAISFAAISGVYEAQTSHKLISPHCVNMGVISHWGRERDAVEGSAPT